MQEFQFKTPGTTIFKAGSAGDPDTYRSLNINGNVLLVSDPTLTKLGISEKVRQAITESGSRVILFDQVEPEPKASSVRKLVEFASSENVSHVVGLGGGSPMDVAKVAALMIPSPQAVESMYGVGNAKGTRLPLVLIPTTAGTGSEGTPVAVVTGDDGEKSPIVGPQFICDSVLRVSQRQPGPTPWYMPSKHIHRLFERTRFLTSWPYEHYNFFMATSPGWWSMGKIWRPGVRCYWAP
jgi:alcohol dehydrogenase class IV